LRTLTLEWSLSIINWLRYCILGRWTMKRSNCINIRFSFTWALRMRSWSTSYLPILSKTLCWFSQHRSFLWCFYQRRIIILWFLILLFILESYFSLDLSTCVNTILTLIDDLILRYFASCLCDGRWSSNVSIIL
jgi:hypothetical protein